MWYREHHIGGSRRCVRAAALIGLSALGLLALLAWPGSPVARAAASACTGPEVTVTFSGSYSDSEQNPTADGYNGGGVAEVASLSISFDWSDTVTGPIDGMLGHPECYPSKDHATYVASGSLSQTPSPNGASVGNQACNATFSTQPGLPNIDYARAGGSSNYQGGGVLTEASVSGVPPNADPTGIQSSDPTCADLSYASGPWQHPAAASLSDPAFFGYENPSIENQAGPNGQLTGPMTKTWKFSVSGSDGWGGTDSVSGSETLSYRIGCSVDSADVALLRAGPLARTAAGSCGNYVALGDSYSSGTSGPEPCLRSADSYPEDYAHNYGASVIFVACSGATSQDIAQKQLSAVNKHTRIVSLTAGGDDARLFDIVISCVVHGSEPGKCKQAIDRSLKSRTTSMARVQDNLVGLYRKIRAKGAKNIRVFVLGYPSPVPRHIPKACVAPLRIWELGGVLGLRQEDAGLFWTVIQSLDRAVKAAADHAHVTYVKPFSGHDICSGDPYFWSLGSGTETLHPNADGARAMAYSLGHAAGAPPG